MGLDTNPVVTNNYYDSSGSDGSVFANSVFNKTTVNARFALHFNDWYDYKLQKHKFMREFMNKKLMRIRTDAEPAIVQYVRAGNFEVAPIENGYHDCLITIPFENPSGYKYSLMNSDSLYEFNEAGWQIGMNIPANIPPLNYAFHHQKFKIYNAGDIAIDPYYQHHELKILSKFKGEFLQIVNNTNGTSWKFNQNSNGNDELLLDGINTTLNGSPASKKTDYGNLVLEPGWNDIIVNGAYWNEILFSFPFIYIG